MHEMLIDIGLAVFIIYAAFSLVYIIEMRRTGIAARALMKNTAEEFIPALSELRNMLENIRKITDDISAVTRDVKEVVGSVADLERTARNTIVRYRNNLEEEANIHAAGIRAGITSGVSSLMDNVKERKERS